MAHTESSVHVGIDWEAIDGRGEYIDTIYSQIQLLPKTPHILFTVAF